MLLADSALYKGLVGGLGALFCYLIYMGFSWLFYYISSKSKKKNKSNNVSEQKDSEKVSDN